MGAICTIIAVVLLLISSAIMQYITFDVKVAHFWRVWVFYNLFFVSIPEEAFFRGFLLKRLMGYCHKWKAGNIISLVISSIIFGLYHYRSGLSLIFLSSIAGLIFGLAYLWSGKQESAIFTHFSVNVIHFFLFSYPCLL